MIRFATIFRIMKTSKILDDKNEYFKVTIKNNNLEEKSFFYKSNINIEFNKIVKIVNDIDDEFIFNLVNIKNKAVSLKNVLTGKFILIHPDYPSDSESIIDVDIKEHIEGFIGESE